MKQRITSTASFMGVVWLVAYALIPWPAGAQVLEPGAGAITATYDIELTDGTGAVARGDTSVTLNKWGDANITISIPGATDTHPVISDNALIYPIDPDRVLNVYAVDDSRFETALEYELVLYNPPASNVILYNIDSDNLRFEKQLPLTQEVTQEECIELWGEGKYTITRTEVLTASGSVMMHRPEWAVNSYAVYHISGRNNEYKTGKAFHIPKGEYVLDMFYSAGQLAVVMDPDILAAHDWGAPLFHSTGLTLGKTSIGASNTTFAQTYIWTSGGTYTAAVDGELWRGWSYGVSSFAFSGTSIKLALYDTGSPNSRIEYTGNISVNNGIGGPGWDSTISLLEGATIDSGIPYRPAIMTTGAFAYRTYFDTAGTNGYYYQNTGVLTPPVNPNWIHVAATHREYSTYWEYDPILPGDITAGGVGYTRPTDNGHLNVWGTEYIPGENMHIYAQLFSSTGTPTAGADISYWIYNSAGALYNSGSLNGITGSNALYVSGTITAPSTTGNYIADLYSPNPKAYGSCELHISDLYDDLKAEIDANEGKIDTVDDYIDTEIAAIKAKTDNLPADPADDSDIDAQLAAIDDYIDTEIAAIKAKTDNLTFSGTKVYAIVDSGTIVCSGTITATCGDCDTSTLTDWMENNLMIGTLWLVLALALIATYMSYGMKSLIMELVAFGFWTAAMLYAWTSDEDAAIIQFIAIPCFAISVYLLYDMAIYMFRARRT